MEHLKDHFVELLQKLNWKENQYKAGTKNQLEMVSIYPNSNDICLLEELSFCLFPIDEEKDDFGILQLYFEFSNKVKRESKEVFEFMCEVNKYLPIGHINLSHLEDKVYYKCNMPFDKDFKVDVLESILNIAFWVFEEYDSKFEVIHL